MEINDNVSCGCRSHSFEEIRAKIDLFLTGPMAELMRAVDYRTSEYGHEPVSMGEVAQGRVAVTHALGSPEAYYQPHAFNQQLELQVQLNVYRLVVVYSIPQADNLDSDALRPRFPRWKVGAKHPGWHTGWRDGVHREIPNQRSIEISCYAMLPHDFLNSACHQLYWMNDIVQMTRALFLEAKRINIRLS